MRIFAIRDESAEEKKDLAWLLYYEAEKRFYIELPEDANEWETPLLLSSFVKKGEKTVDSHWSKVWVQQRIVPPDRQNIGQVLKDNGLKEYDEFELLLLAMGRCAQDDCYLTPLEEEELPPQIQARFERRVEDVLSLGRNTLLVFFRDGEVRKCDLTGWLEAHTRFSILLKRGELFDKVRVETGGHGVSWDENMSIPDYVLYQSGEAVPLTMEDFYVITARCIINTSEAAEILNCSRQNIQDLIRRGKLHPVKATSRSTLLLKSEVLKRMRTKIDSETAL
ncbi:MAG: helix-turn-helix domain-containing protein [Lachnospiraceae bacterium]|nr:helix-turn-helix domain-containing protein [Lachnospiraceae bacterium]